MNLEDFFVAYAPASRAVRDRAVELAATGLPVLIVGPEGSGRRRLAELIHRLSPRQDRPWRTLDCPGLTDSTWGRRLYGTTDTAIHDARPGLLEQAADGTLLFVGADAAPTALLHTLRDILDGRPLTRTDADRPLAPRCRVLATAAPDGKIDYLKTLFARVLQVPPLAQRPQDIPNLVRHLLDQLTDELGAPLAPPGDDLLERLSRLPWSDGEVQQLRRALRFAVQGSTDGIFRETLLPDWVLTQLAGPAKPAMVIENDPGSSRSERLETLIRVITLDCLELDAGFPPPAFSLRCRRSDFQNPVIREIIGGTLAACDRHLARNLRDIKAGARPILRYLPPATAEDVEQTDLDDLVDYFRAAIELRIKKIRELPDDTDEEIFVEIVNNESADVRRPAASRPEVEEAYDRIVAMYTRIGKGVPSRKEMVPLLEQELLKKVPPTYVTDARKKRGHDRSGSRYGKPGAKVGMEIALEREGEERFNRDRHADVDAQIQSDRLIDLPTQFERMDDGELTLEATKLGIHFDSVMDLADKIRLLIEATKIRDYIRETGVKSLAKELGINAAGKSQAELGDLVFHRTWQKHLAGRPSSSFDELL